MRIGYAVTTRSRSSLIPTTMSAGHLFRINRTGDFFTRKRLLSIVAQTASSASDLVDRIKTSVSTHVHDAPPSDDITMLAVRRLSQN
ncbi:MAG: SpoIIE family protein phosphatase [Deltaproteobacteria bacterium]|nr:SpoIIE family protein phosphatase [Deltaproteobacteria bacterium]